MGKLPKLLGLTWFLLSVAVIAYSGYLALFVAPTEATMGNIQRIFYWHVPSNIFALLLPYVNLGASISFLAMRNRNPLAALAADALAVASAEATLVFASIGIATGMLWGKPVWGIWWTWDARLTTFLLLWLLYVAYLMTRRLSTTGQTGTLGAVLAIFAAADVPIVYYSIQWWRTQHPSPVLTGNGKMDAAMWPAFWWSLAGWAMWAVLIVGLRYQLERRRQRAFQAATLAAIEDSMYPALTNQEAPNAL